eukprot:TRINITY_DN949_c0_g1_i9.p1 TRINITY_DN949_c0_g1~~TRINITY_DN949_c0_g1_i9.p1  ORF type:complete len:133 (+),score=15.38 TRINITY_DN949_c0_g1_i9:138-536(+)
MIRRPPRSTLSSSSAASDVYKRQKLPSGQHYLLLGGGVLGEALLAGLDVDKLVHLANTAGVHKKGKPRTALAVVLVHGEGLLDAILVGLHGLVVVSVVLRLGHCKCCSIKYRDPVLCVDTCLLYTSPSPRDS